MGDTRVRAVPAALQTVAWPKAVTRAHQAGSPHTGAPARPVDGGQPRRPWEIRDAADADGAAELWLYDEIGGWGIWAEDLVRDLSRISAKSIVVRLNSPGGDVFDGVAIMNALIEHPADITIRVDGLAASIASVITLAGNRVIMGHSAQMMIHNASTMAWGEAADLRQTADLLEKISATIAQAYADRTGTDPAEWQARMDAETWLTAQECVTLGLADEVAALPARETSGDPQPGHDPDTSNRTAAIRPAAAVPLRPAAAWPGAPVVDQAPDTTGPAAPADASTAVADASTGGDPAPVTAASEPAEPDEPEDGPPGTHPDAAVLGQALAWWLAIDQVADRMLAQIAAALGVPNPDQDSDDPPPPLPDGDAGLGAILGALTSADTIVDGAQAILARRLGIPNPDPDAAGETGASEASEVEDSASATGPVTATTTDTPGTGATAPTTETDAWADITASFTNPAPALAGAYTTQEGAWWL